MHNQKEIRQQVTDLLPEGVQTAFKYIMSLKYEDKPNYNLIRLWLTSSKEDEQTIFTPTTCYNRKACKLFNKEMLVRNMAHCEESESTEASDEDSGEFDDCDVDENISCNETKKYLGEKKVHSDKTSHLSERTFQ